MPKATVQKPTTKSRTPTSKQPSGGVLSRIAPIGFDDDDGIKMLLYGRSGTGKTTFWSTFPGRLLSVICSGSDKPAELRSIDTADNRKRIDQVVLTHTEELDEVIAHVRDSGAYNGMILDHASGYADLKLKEILGLDEMPVQKSWGLASQQQYGQLAMMCKDQLRRMLSLPCNVIIIAQERTFGGGDEGNELLSPTVGAGLSPSLAGWLNTAVDYICQTFIREEEVAKKMKVGTKTVTSVSKTGRVEYCLRTEPHPVYTTKFRMPKGSEIPKVIADPSYEKVMAIIRGQAG